MLPKTVFEQVGSTSWTVWRGYLLLAVACLNHLPFGSALMGPDDHDPIVLTAAALMAGLPQLLIVLAGGLIVRRCFPRPRQSPLECESKAAFPQGQPGQGRFKNKAWFNWEPGLRSSRGTSRRG